MGARDIEDDLDAFVIGDTIPPDEPPPTPDDAHGATRLLAAVRSREREIERVTELARRRIEPIVEWQRDRVAGAKRSIEFIERSLEVWMRGTHQRTGSVTEQLPDGELRVRPGKAALVATDEETALVWARREHRHWVRAKFEIDKPIAKKEVGPGPPLSALEVAKLKLDDPPATHRWCKVAVATGEIVPGLAILEPVERVFGYTTSKAQEPEQQTMMEET